MIGMRAMRQHFYLELICQNCFAHSGLVQERLFCEALLIIVQVNRSVRNIEQQHLFDI